MVSENGAIPAEAVEAAARGMCGTHPYSQWEYKSQIARDALRAKAKQALEAAAPHMLATHLLTLAADVKARGDIGKDGGLEAWDYLTWKAEKLRSET